LAKKFYYGGQAVVEGVMMRGQKTMVIAVRRPDGGLVTKTQPLSAIYTGWMRKTPLVRGIVVLIEAMVLGINSLLYSANVSLEDEKEEVSGGMLWIVLIVALLLAVGLFLIAPLFLTRLLHIGSPLLFNLVDGLIRVAFFVAYLKAMTLMPDIRRVFAYHGAEHKTINAYEAGAPLEVESVSRYSTAHARCGTSFLFVVLIMSILLFALVGLHSSGIMIVWRILLIPVIAALSYEVIYFSSRHTGNVVVRAILSPGLWLQTLTTRQPDAPQVEVAIAALREAMSADQTVS
jgi:uncharacterized protein YqhQ